MSEGNSCWNGGQPGVSDTLASALWVADMMLDFASLGCAGVNLHGGGSGFYTPIAGSLAAGFERRPEYFGMELIKQFAGATLIRSTLECANDRIRAYAARNPNRVRVHHQQIRSARGDSHHAAPRASGNGCSRDLPSTRNKASHSPKATHMLCAMARCKCRRTAQFCWRHKGESWHEVKKNWSRRRFLRDASLTGAVLAQRGSLPALSAEIPAESITSEHVLFFEQPAATWPDALPVGNGRLGAMVFGNPANERLQLNEETVWIGERRDRNNPQAGRTPEVRKLLMAGKVHEAEALAAQVMMGVPDRLPCYQTLGDLWLDFDNVPATVKDYRLELDLDEAVVKTRFNAAGAQWTREVFSSAPRNVIVARIESMHPFALTVRLDRPAHSETTAAASDRLVMTGAARPVKPTTDPATQEQQVGVAFRAEVKAIPEGGNVRAAGNTLRIENCPRRHAAAYRLHRFSRARRSRHGRSLRPQSALRGGPHLQRTTRRACSRLPPLCQPRQSSFARRSRPIARRRHRQAHGAPPQWQRRSRPHRHLLPVRPLHAHQQQPPRHAARPICRASGTRASIHRGDRSSPSTSTPR